MNRRIKANSVGGVLTAGALAFGLIGLCEARTVALWPLEHDALNPKNGGRCAVDAANDLTVANVNGHVDAVEWGPGWNLPPNPDTAEGLRFQPVNRTANRSASGKTTVFGNADFAARYLKPSQAFTIEGWLNVEALPKDYFWVIATAFGSSDNNRFLFTLRNNNGGCTKVTHPDATDWVSFQVWSGRPAIGECVLWKVEGEDLANLLNKWHHFALTHNPANADGNAEWKLYWDGELKGTKVCDGPGTDAGIGDRSFTLNGRPAGSSLPGYIDYCRVSDAVLEPEDFLCAGGQGTVIPVPADPEANTLVYWPLGKTPNGGIDGTPAVGTAVIGGGNIDAATQNTTRMVNPLAASDDRAFTGTVPNTATSLKPASDNGGSLHIPWRRTNSLVEIQNLGKQTSLTNDFTVEGWYKYERRDSEKLNTWHYLCGAIATPGWKLQMHIDENGASGYYSMHVQLSDADRIHSVAGPNFGSVDEGVWTHLALVYDADGHEGEDGVRTGLWKFYKNGVQTGTIYNTKAIPDGLTLPTAFYLGSSMLGEKNNSLGKYDSWRVSRAALTPDQFLCATESPKDATDVCAFWPLDAKDGVYIDGTDLTGNHTFITPREDKFRATAVDDTPPQADLDPSSGSTGFGGDGGLASCLLTTDPEVCSLFQTNSWTFETWMKCTDPTKSWMVVFWPNATSNLRNANPSGCISFTYRPVEFGGFVIWNNTMVEGTSDAVFRGTDGQAIALPKDEWTHVALEFEKIDTVGKWSLFTNGVLAATIQGAFKAYPSISNVIIGSRPKNPQTFYGRMAGMRLSKTALDPKDFLCSRTVRPSAKTVGFWPLESDGTALDLDSRIGVDEELGAKSVTGVARGARGRVPNPDQSADFRGNRKANHGSVELAADGRLQIGFHEAVYAHSTFTVEGWMKWDAAAGPAVGTIVGNWDVANRAGWRLAVDSTVTPARFRIVARGKAPATKFVDACFPAEVAPGEWHHVALAYDPTKNGYGTWSLRIDSVDAGEVVNDFRPGYGLEWDDAFRLGAAGDGEDAVSFVGGLDMWRLSTGLLGSQELLWAEPLGALLLLR